MSVKIILALLFSITVWGGSFPVAKLALEELTPLNLAALRFTVASLLFIPVVLLVQRRQDEPGIPWPSRPDLLRLNGLAWLGVTIHFLLQYSAVARTTASNAGLIIAISPLFVVLISNFWLKEPFTWRQLVGILVASFGVAVVISRGTFQFSFGSQTLQGDLIMVVDAFFWALFSICGREMMRRLNLSLPPFTLHRLVLSLGPAGRPLDPSHFPVGYRLVGSSLFGRILFRGRLLLLVLGPIPGRSQQSGSVSVSTAHGIVGSISPSFGRADFPGWGRGLREIISSGREQGSYELPERGHTAEVRRRLLTTRLGLQ
jgi:drug/metabolite transporter (DMT)-like permease